MLAEATAAVLLLLLLQVFLFLLILMLLLYVIAVLCAQVLDPPIILEYVGVKRYFVKLSFDSETLLRKILWGNHPLKLC